METRRCCAPSCRLRSMRRRSASAASTMRVRDAASSSRRARSSASSRSLVAPGPPPRDGLHQRRVAPDRRVVHQHGDLLALVRDRRHRALGAVGQLDGVAPAVDVPAVRQRVRHLQRGVAEGPGQRVAQLARRRRRPELDHQRGDVAAREPLPQQAHGERHRDDGDEADQHPLRPVAERLVEHVVADLDQARHEERRACQQHGRRHAPHRLARGPVLAHQQRGRDAGQHDRRPALRLHDELREVVAAMDEQQVVRAAALELRVGVGQGQPQKLPAGDQDEPDGEQPCAPAASPGAGPGRTGAGRRWRAGTSCRPACRR